ncbi:transcription termination/antitermination protein NusG [Sphaerochaeta halotolerans]|jgi:transcriptional antiterminator NusG|uniref:transcription termination/antitermination protein NusG n=1 Tax=Sphaerochaeta halotolerans TaxID=2293840 RepID=UPI0013705E30|nr:transcription termination/antitermination NusG family protein [Sphaerochaeta halotolerans]MXI87821.1 antitermination protein NusG [Sphaerochaeta halotolerans]
MNYYFIACRTGREEYVKAHLLKFFSRELEEDEVMAFIPMRRMIDRRKGKKIMTDHPILPGYLLLSSEVCLQDFSRDVLKLPGCYGFLRNLNKTIELRGPDYEYAAWIMHNKGTIRPSKVVYKKGEPIKIIDGPMQDFMGTIVKVDYRHSRVMVEFQFAEVIRRVSMPVEFVESSR